MQKRTTLSTYIHTITEAYTKSWLHQCQLNLILSYVGF